jgi:hypothetical protein
LELLLLDLISDLLLSILEIPKLLLLLLLLLEKMANFNSRGSKLT